MLISLLRIFKIIQIRFCRCLPCFNIWKRPLEWRISLKFSLSTRPDCIRQDYLEAFQNFRERTGIEVSIELGLQTVNYHTLSAMNRGHGLAEFINAVLLIAPYHFPVCVHMILNLPGDAMEDARESARVLSALPVSMVKVTFFIYSKGMCII